MEAEVLFSRHGGVGKILLNRPKALNSLTLGMCHGIEAQLRAWAEDDAVKAVVVRGAGDRAFCAGGDIRKLHDGGKAGDDYPYQFWADEYRLNALIKHYKKPYIAFLDGITMGGGVGLSVHGPYRVASEHILFAMPETGIGLFPDVGGSYALSRCPGQIGLYLGLTGARLKAPDCVYAGLATHYVPRARLDALEAALADDAGNAHAVLARFDEDAGAAPLAGQRNEIDFLFAGRTVSDIVVALHAADTEFARATAETLAGKSPTSMCLTLAQIRRGATQTFDDCMRMEWRMASHAPRHLHDFYEGVRAVIIEKDNQPAWAPATLEAVDPAAIEAYFAPSLRGELKLY